MNMKKKFVVSVSSGVYTRGLGGTNKVICAHQEMFNKHSISYLYLCPVLNGITKRLKINTDNYWNVIIDGNYIGVASTTDLIIQLKNQCNNGFEMLGLFIHHLRGVSTDALTTLIDRINVSIYYYIHDYYAICKSYNLIDSSKKYCGGFHEKDSCSNCSYREEAELVRSKVRTFLNRFRDRTIYIAPSNAARDIWTKHFPNLERQTIVIYHQCFCGTFKRNNAQIKEVQKIKVAFVGAALPVKGWHDFCSLVSSINKDALGEYEFYHMGVGGEEQDEVKQVDVTFHSGLNAMVSALRENSIDCAILWSVWPETYSYTYYECFAANCFILTSKDSGNMCDQVVERKNGLVFSDINEMIQFFNDPKKVKQTINHFYKENIYGPSTLEENEEIVDLIEKYSNKGFISTLSNEAKKNIIKSKLLRATETIMREIEVIRR